MVSWIAFGVLRVVNDPKLPGQLCHPPAIKHLLSLGRERLLPHRQIHIPVSRYREKEEQNLNIIHTVPTHIPLAKLGHMTTSNCKGSEKIQPLSCIAKYP